MFCGWIVTRTTYTAFCILVVRGSLVNMGFFFQAKAAILATQSKQLPTSILTACQMYPESVLLTTFFAIFGVVIALMKDVPDVEVGTVTITISLRL